MTSIEISKPGKEILFIASGFWISYFLLNSLEPTFASLISQFIPLRSEYNLGEQLSKLYLLIMIQVSFIGYLASANFQRIGLNITFLLLGLCLYLSESNMIAEENQPLFGLTLLASVGYFLVRSRCWTGLLFLMLGIFAIGSGSLLDRLSDAQSTEITTTPQLLAFLTNHPNFSEEKLDLFGISSFCLAALLSECRVLESFLSRAGKKTLLLVLGLVLTAFGNGFIHHQYEPEDKLYLVALIMSIVGFSLFKFTSNKVQKKWFQLKDYDLTVIYAAFFVFFVYLPSIYEHLKNVPSLLLWLPSFLFIGWWLWQKHPLQQKLS